tara:strand:- start:17846 stop:18244 length:399 start_codon:yes stop_codon:yes gene_type:complete
MNKPTIINLPKIADPRGNLSFFENLHQIPFNIKRAYWIYDVPGGQERGGHAFKYQQEFVIALSGSLDIVLDDGKETCKLSLNRSYFGLYIPSGYWRHMENFSTNSVVLIVSDSHYDSNDYIRDKSEFKSYFL